MRNLIEISGIEVYAYHGCMEEEAKLGGKYTIDVELETNFLKAAETDELEDTIDYVDVRRIVVEEMKIRSKLIEHVGYRIQKRLRSEYPKLIRSRIKVSKLNPPIEGVVKEVAIIIER